jgi:oxygen-independent coproporphyrinogen-3 oxidase
MIPLPTALAGSLYQGYTYAYPHKTAYRPLDPPIRLGDLWAGERREALFLYVHVPFCEMRCGFCNLFTQARPKGGLVGQYLDALRRQAVGVRQALGEVRFARFAVGGGTPTQLDLAGLETVLDVAEAILGADLRAIPVSVEASPETVTADKLALLAGRGVDRLSLGVQTFVEAEAHAVGRPQKTAAVERALDLIRQVGFPTLNIDLIYGLPGQTLTTWLNSVRRALEYAPEELYLYPLYVRPLTGLGHSQREWDDIRRRCYRRGRRLLLNAGYRQVSMRMFRAPHAPAEEGPVYCCQEDGMVGLGCGARSYTRALHYSSEYAVGAAGIREILAAFVARPEESFDFADYGFRMDAEEQRRRYIIQSLLAHEGLGLGAYRHRFGSDAFDDLPQLHDVEREKLAVRTNGTLRLTELGVEHSDAIGPWLYSGRVRQLMKDYQWR